MWPLRQPTESEAAIFLATVRDEPYSYDEVGVSGDPPDGDRARRFTCDHQRGLLGEGDAAWEAAQAAIRNWRMFPRSWTAIHPRGAAIEEENVVALAICTFGLWWLCSCRVVRVIDEPLTAGQRPVARFGFAYGTLPDHVEEGEEQFIVEQDEQGRVWYDLKAWSRPRHWTTRLGYPIARWQQARFRRQSLAAMQQAVREEMGR